MEVEEPRSTHSTSLTQNREKNGIYPFDLCCCLPPHVARPIPKQIRKIQSKTHLILLLGILACIFLLTDSCYSLYGRVSSLVRGGKTQEGVQKLQFFCLEELLCLLFMTPCLAYLGRTVGQYDEDLRLKKREAKAARAYLLQSLHATYKDMDQLLVSASESNAGFAERSFETKRRDFVRFLDRMQSKDLAAQLGSNDAERLLLELKRFCASWLKVFSECSMDPVKHPLDVATTEQLIGCGSIPELCLLCIERLNSTQVRFLTSRKDSDSRTIEDERRKTRSMSACFTVLDIDCVEEGPEPCCRKVSWIECGKGRPIARSAADKEFFPRTYRLGCCSLTILSREHSALIAGFLVGLVLVVLEIALPDTQFLILGCMVIAQICLVITLIRFEDVDLLQQLTRESSQLTEEQHRLDIRHEKMKDFWTRVQDLTDMWLHRTVPRLDLFSEIHGHMEDMPELRLLKSLQSANHNIEQLEGHLGPIAAWCAGGYIDEKTKASFSQSVQHMCEFRDLDGILVQVEKLTRTGLPQFAPQ